MAYDKMLMVLLFMFLSLKVDIVIPLKESGGLAAEKGCLWRRQPFLFKQKKARLGTASLCFLFFVNVIRIDNVSEFTEAKISRRHNENLLV